MVSELIFCYMFLYFKGHSSKTSPKPQNTTFMRTKYIFSDTARLKIPDGKDLILLWGDKVKIDVNDVVDGNFRCKARGYEGYISPDDLGDESLLEIYIIDVGQGDGILIKCPDPSKRKLGRHIMIDGGYMREKQPHKKNAADFVDWKFYKDYGKDKIKIDDMIVSHCDADHYGGLWDLVSDDAEAKRELDCDEVEVTNLYHAGVSWWRLASGADRSLGRKVDNKLIDILTDRNSIASNLDTSVYPYIQGEYGDFLRTFLRTQPNTNIEFVGYEKDSNDVKYLPGYEAGASDITIEVLGPVYETSDGDITISNLGSNSKNTNGNSIVLSLRYENFKMLLTGDLNKKSQKQLLEVHHPSKFSSDVVKACHHGSHDVSFQFLQHINAAATVISSGDNESHAHPTANLLSMSALSGYRVDGNDTIKSPLIFSTEIARSVRIGSPISGRLKHPTEEDPDNTIHFDDISDLRLTYDRADSGDLNREIRSKTLNKLSLIDGIVYGLVNIRTDGQKILFAIRKEKGNGWETSTIQSRFPVV